MENEQIKQKFPIGMTIILILIGSGPVFWLLYAFISPINNKYYQLGPVLVSGAGAIIVNLVIAGILGTIFYGITKRLRWARKLAIGLYIFLMILSLINLISFFANKTMYDSYYQKLFSPEAYSTYNSYYQKLYSPEVYSMITPAATIRILVSGLKNTWIMGLIIIIYLARKKDFFVN